MSISTPVLPPVVSISACTGTMRRSAPATSEVMPGTTDEITTSVMRDLSTA